MSWARRLPWPFFLLFAGTALAAAHLVPWFRPSSVVVLVAFLPALLFDAGFSLPPSAVRLEWRWILLFGLLGSLLAAAILYVLLLALGFDRDLALLLAAILAATDPVSVFAALRQVDSPQRLRLTLEGESLVNDAVAILLTATALGILTAGGVRPGALASLFLRLAIVGLLIGALIGLAGRSLLPRLPALAAIALTAGLAYGAYVLSDRLGGSGLLAVITLALLLRTGQPADGDRRLERFWRWAGTLMAAAVFLTMGLQVEARAVLDAGARVLVLVAAGWIARALMVLIVTGLNPRLWPWRWRAALTWAGLRGALTLALALSIPAALSGRSAVIVLAFGYIFVTLALQGLSIGPIFRSLGIARAVS